MWFVCALITFFAWGTADLFYKKGNNSGEDYSHLKTSVAVGLVMGVSALVTWIARVPDYDFRNLLIYLPVSAMYILSMTVGYFGLRYLAVSVSSPVQNASGAVSAILLMVVLRELPDIWTLSAIVLITGGVVLLGVFERREEAAALNRDEDRRHRIGFVAFLMPILYCVLDSLGTFFDGLYLDDPDKTPLRGANADNLEDVANISYQLTFFLAAIVLILWLTLVKKERLPLKAQGPRFLAALFETGGQITYVYAMSGRGVAAAPLIAGYCVASLVLGRIFLKEKLKPLQYAAVALVVAGIVILGVLEGLEE